MTTTLHGYREQDLVQNRTSLLLSGGREEDRRAWAQEAAAAFPTEGGLRELSTVEALRQQPLGTRGVVFVPDVVALGIEAQGTLVQLLMQEEKPKLVLGLSSSPTAAVAAGLLREDLAYRLQHARVDLSLGEVKEAIRVRRQKRAAREKVARSKPQKKGKAAAAKAKKPSRSGAKPARPAARRNTMRVKPKSHKPAKKGAPRR